jgi:hypothetical protein
MHNVIRGHKLCPQPPKYVIQIRINKFSWDVVIIEVSVIGNGVKNEDFHVSGPYDLRLAHKSCTFHKSDLDFYVF